MEVWRDVLGRPGYQVSNAGRVRSLNRVVDCAGDTSRGPYVRYVTGRLLRLNRDATGYLHCHIGRVHNLVISTFIGQPPSNAEVRHLNGDRTDNRLENLCYGTATDNARDAIRHGTATRGARNARARLTEEQAGIIKYSGHDLRILSAAFGISLKGAQKIRYGERWAWL